MFSIFKKKVNNLKNTDEFLMPVSGKVISLDDVDDEVFSKRMMGDGFAIEPENGHVFSPIDGVITCAFVTKHAISIKSDSGVEVLVHFGLDTVDLKGEGFEIYVKQGDSIKAGDKLLEVDIEKIKDKVKSIVVPIIFMDLNGKKFTYNVGRFEAKESGVVSIK